MAWTDALSSGTSGGGGPTYGNSGSSAVRTDVSTTAGGIGPVQFDFSNNAFSGKMSTQQLLIYAAIGVALFLLFRRK